MSLLQFKSNHKGKALETSADKKPKLTRGYVDRWGQLNYGMSPPTENDDLFDFDYIGEEFYKEFKYINWNGWSRPGLEEQKWILFEIERHVATHPKYSFLKEEFVLVQTQDPNVNDFMAARPQRFWVKADWVEPYNKNYKTHLGEAKGELLKKLQQKWAKKK